MMDLQNTPETILYELGERLKALRKYRKYSRDELAARSGVSKATIERMENHKAPITIDNLISIAFALEAEGGFRELFKKPKYRNIDEFLADED